MSKINSKYTSIWEKYSTVFYYNKFGCIDYKFSVNLSPVF